MIKAMVCLGRGKHEQNSWNQSLLDVSQSLSDDCLSISLAMRDKTTEAGMAIINTTHPNDAVVSISAKNPYRISTDIEKLSALGTAQVYVVTESQALPLDQSASGRIDGFCQMAFFKQPQTLSKPEWLDLWLGQHTQIAIDTQSSFAYRQNVVHFQLPFMAEEKDWPIMDAIVEEHFPIAAMTSAEVFFNAVGDAEKLQQHQQKMSESCARFIDFSQFDCLSMSYYQLRSM